MDIVPQPHTTLETLWEASRCGLITWDSVQRFQANMMPRCANHPERAAPVVWDDIAVCADCVTALISERQALEESHA